MASKDTVMQWLKSAPQTSRRYIVFTSAGDNSCLRQWANPHRKYDIFVCYYGSNGTDYSDCADYLVLRQGSKFQNLRAVYFAHPEIFRQYEHIFILDDDLGLTARKINKLFEAHEKLGLLGVQPAFFPGGKISWPLTRYDPTLDVAYCNFIEMSAPLLKRDFVERFMQELSPDTLGYGEDFWYADLARREGQGNCFAVIHSVGCSNPKDILKGDRREIDALQKPGERIPYWQRIREQHGLSFDRYDIRVGPIVRCKRPLVPFRYLDLIRASSNNYVKNFIGRLKRKLGRGLFGNKI
jgi:hypothetical protein